MRIIIQSNSRPVARSLDILPRRAFDRSLGKDLLAILFPHLADYPAADLELAYDGRALLPGQAAPLRSSFTTVTVTVNLPHDVFGPPARADADFAGTAPDSAVFSDDSDTDSLPGSGRVVECRLGRDFLPLPRHRDHTQDRAAIQKPLASITMVRDSCCVVTRVPFPDQLNCAHVLPPAVALKHFNEPGGPIPAGIPMASNRYTVLNSTLSYDVRNAMILRKDLHAGYKAFEWSVTGIDGRYQVFVFRGSDGYDGRQLRFPPLIDGAEPEHRNYYQDCFPTRGRFAVENEPDESTAGTTVLASAAAAPAADDANTDVSDEEDENNSYESDTDYTLQEIFCTPGSMSYDYDSD
ncbi:hypothetical protein HDU89_004611 [Geranomyces variabilis]|nr:hypothetical protein HDU89_004611 [Geranomyces variabilis]